MSLYLDIRVFFLKKDETSKNLSTNTRKHLLSQGMNIHLGLHIHSNNEKRLKF